MSSKLGIIVASATTAFALTGCYVVPVVDQQGTLQYYPQPLPPAGSTVARAPVNGAPTTLPAAPSTAGQPLVLTARLYPDNDVATPGGVINGTVTNMMNGKGRFQLQYGSEVLAGEATRVANDERKGIASAFGHGGSYMSCEYQMSSPRQGAGVCLFSNGARYTLHIGG